MKKPATYRLFGILSIALLAGSGAVSAQDLPVEVTLSVLPVETLRLSDFDPTNPASAPVVFNLTLQNDDQERDLRAFVLVRGTRTGPVGTASIDLGTVFPRQVVTVTNQQFTAYDFDNTTDALLDFALERGVLPPDTYQFQVTITDLLIGSDIIVGQGTTEITTTNSAFQIDLIAPGSELGQSPDELAVTAPVFQWQAEGMLFDFELFEVVPGQISADDIVTNLPVFSARELGQNTFAYPGYAEQLKSGATYAWRVLVRSVSTEGTLFHPSELLWFRIQGESSETQLDYQIPVSAIEVSPQEQTIPVGGSVNLSADILDVNGDLVPTRSLSWSVIPESMGKVTADGLFTAGSRPGVAAVLATAGSAADYATITVEAGAETELRQDSVYVFVDSPMNAHTFVEPSPVFAWHTVGADSLGPLTYALSLKELDEDGGERPIWSRSTPATTLAYPSEERSLTEGSRYLFDVSAIDTSGTVVGTADQIEFALARNPKLSWDLYNAWDEAIRDGRDTTSITILTLIRTPRLPTAVRQSIAQVGGTIELAEGPWLQLNLPYRSLEAIASLADIRMMTVPAPHVLFNPIDARASSDHINPLMPMDALVMTKDDAGVIGNAAIDFAPIDIAVFEFGFDRLEIASILDMNRVRFHTFRQDNKIEGASPADAEHGVATVTALAEHLPPSATIHLINFDTEPEFQQALRYAVEELGVKVISCSVSWANAYDHYDGTSLFSTGVAETLGDKAALVVAAGNFAKSHWEGPYSDTNKDGANNFGSGSSFLDLKLSGDQHYNFLLSWADWGEPRMDLDLQILGPDGEPLYDEYGREYASRNLQRDAQFVEPIERIRAFGPIFPGVQDYRVRVSSNTASRDFDNIAFELYVYPPPVSSTPVANPSSSLASGLATTNSDLVIPVAALGFQHSSRGPTNDGRIRPDFATDGSIQIGGNRYEGTSFATPRVAAVLSNILARNPGWTPIQAVAFLKSYSLLPDGDEKDNILGWGSINIQAALGSQ